MALILQQAQGVGDVALHRVGRHDPDLRRVRQGSAWQRRWAPVEGRGPCPAARQASHWQLAAHLILIDRRLGLLFGLPHVVFHGYPAVQAVGSGQPQRLSELGGMYMRCMECNAVDVDRRASY